MNNTEQLDKIFKLASEMQEEWHKDSKKILAASSKRNITAQDAMNAQLFKKLAEFEIRLRNLEQASDNSRYNNNIH